MLHTIMGKTKCKNYLVTIDGMVLSMKRRNFRWMSITPTVDGRLRVMLANKQWQVSQLIMSIFDVEGYEKYPVVRHLNGEATDNRIENLKCGTHSENLKDAWKHGIYEGRMTGNQHSRRQNG